MKQVFGYHFVAFLTVAIWGSTFVFTKILLQNGLSPAQIFTIRFILAYVLMEVVTWVVGQKVKWLSNSVRDELIMVLLGITGGSLYFLTENASMVYTTATNTSLIVCTCPLFAMLLLKMVYPKSERVTKMMALGSPVWVWPWWCSTDDSCCICRRLVICWHLVLAFVGLSILC